jgi:hypothetical protein
MFLTLHAVAGALAGELSPNPVAAFGFGFLSHFPLDMFPHGDRKFGEWTKKTGKVSLFTIMTIVDVVAAFGIMMAAFAFGRFEHPFYAFLGMMGGLLPDGIVGFTEYVKIVRKSARIYFRRFYRFHTFNHNHVITKYDFGMKFGLVYQVAFLVLFVMLW